MPPEPSSPTTPPAPPTQPGAVPGETTVSADEIEKGKVLAILGYIIWIIALVPLIQKDNRFSLYHAKQVLTAFICLIPLFLLSFIPLLGCFIWIAAMVCVLGCIIMGIINCVNHRMAPLPVIGKFGEQWFKGIQVQAAPGNPK